MVRLPYRKNPPEGSFTATKLRGSVFTDDIPSESQDLSIVYALHKLALSSIFYAKIADHLSLGHLEII